MTTDDLFLKPFLKWDHGHPQGPACIEIRSRSGEVFIKSYAVTPLKAVRKLIKLSDDMEAEKHGSVA
jgi:hypothetical protein